MTKQIVSQPIDKGRIVDPVDRSVAARYKLNDIYCAAWLSHAITAIATNGVADALDDEPLLVSAIAAKTGLHSGALYRALRALAANGIFREPKLGLFEHNDVSRLLRSDHPFSWKGMSQMWNHPSCLSGWEKFGDVLKDGRSGIEHAFGKPLYDHLNEVPGGTEAFSDAMISNSAHPSIAIAKTFPFDRYNSVADLAGGIGTLLAAVLEHHRHLHGILFEIDELTQPAREYLRQRGLEARVEIKTGNFIEAVPEGPDLYMVKNSLWNWDDAQCLRIMQNVRDAIGARLNARFLIIEYIIDLDNAEWVTAYDLQILNMPGGRARTLDEYAHLLAKAGFVLESTSYVQDQILLLAAPR